MSRRLAETLPGQREGALAVARAALERRNSASARRRSRL